MPGSQQAIQILVPLAGRRAATEEEGGGDWLPIIPLGKWAAHHFPREGPYEITAANVAEMIANAGRGLPPNGIPGNEGHSLGQAVGWGQELRASDDGLELRIVWTALGERLLSEQLYRFLSPEWYDDQWPYVISTSGERVPWVVSGFGLTNSPFFTELPAVAERRPDGTIIYSPLTAVWEETEKQIRHTVRDSADFREDTFAQKEVEPSAVRSVEVDFEISDAMASGVSMVLAKLKPDKVPEGNDPDSMVLQAMRFTLKTDEQDGWTLSQAKDWFTKSDFASKGASAMADAAQTINHTPEAKAEIAKAQTERDAAVKERDELRAKEQTAAIQEKLTSLKAGNRVLAPAYVEKAAQLIGGAKDKEPDALAGELVELLQSGLVEVGERGAAGGAGGPLISETQKGINAAFGVTEEQFLKYYPQG